MFFVKILGVLDLITAIILIFNGAFAQSIILFGAKYLLLKGGLFAFMGDKASIIDFFCGVYMVLVAYDMGFSLATVLVAIFLVQKSAFSLIL